MFRTCDILIGFKHGGIKPSPSAFSITPYIYFNLGAKEKYDMGFPSFPCYWKLHHSALIQLLIQRRITTNTLSSETSCLIQMSTRRRPLSLATPPTRRNIKWMQAHGCCCSSSLSVASVVGYVGCFSAVQNSIMNIGPVSWLCLDAGFSVLRLAIWTWNPTRDNFASTGDNSRTGHFLLEEKIDAQIDHKDDPVSSDSNNLDSLRKYHQSILEHIRYRLANRWTMKVEDTISTK
jgi:hypothetical protein